MTTTEARARMTQIAEALRARGELDKAARVELVREYFTNPVFRLKLADHVWEQLNH